MRTPTGTIVAVVAVNDALGEALVQWPDGQFADFRMSQLKPLPGGES